MDVGVGSGPLVGPIGGYLYIQVQVGGIRSGWDQVGVGSGSQVGARGSCGSQFFSWKCSSNFLLGTQPTRVTLPDPANTL